MVGNEADILPIFLAHATTLFDGISVVDHQSTDGTRLILEQFANDCDRVELFDFRYRARYQKEVSNCLARRALRNGADWVFFLDADEFLDVEDRESLEDLVETFPHEVMRLRWMNLVPSVMGSFPSFDGSQLFRWDGTFSNFGKIAFSSAFAAQNPHFYVQQGNHSVSRSRFDCAVHMEEGCPILHVPIRSVDRFRYKIAAGIRECSAKSERDPRVTDGSDWFQLRNRMEQGPVTTDWINGVIARYGEPLDGVEPVDVSSANWRQKTLPGAAVSGHTAAAISLAATIQADANQTFFDLSTVDGAILRAEIRDAQIIPLPQAMSVDGSPRDDIFAALAPAGDGANHSFDHSHLATAISHAFTPIKKVVPSAWTDHAPFLFTLFSLMRPRRYVEIGTHHGMSFFAACQAAHQLEIGTECIAVDGWIGDEHAGFYDNQIFETFKAHLTSIGYKNSFYIRSVFDQALSCFEDASIDLLHVDGLHTYDAVKNDYSTWLPKMSSRGVIIFHDTNVYRPDFGVWLLWNELKAKYPHFHVPHCHGLGVIYVGSEFSPIAELLRRFEGEESLRTAAISFFTGLGAMSVRRTTLDQELSSLRAEYENLSRAYGDNETLQRARAENDELRRMLTENDTLKAVIAENKALSEEVERLRETINYIWTTTSWRLTRPVRMVGSTLKVVRRSITKIA